LVENFQAATRPLRTALNGMRRHVARATEAMLLASVS
jgi:hypothetical protein